jgi:two-component system, OmpR family, sensor kinase
MTPQERAGAPRSGWRRWLAGRTLRARLIAGLLALFTVASIGVGLATTIALRSFLLSQLDTQVTTAGIGLSHAIENQPGGQGPGQGPGGVSGNGGAGVSSCAGATQNGLAVGQQLGTFAARLFHGKVTYACKVTTTGLATVRLSRPDIAVLTSLPVSSPSRPDASQPSSHDLSGIGDYRLIAVMGGDGDVHIAGLPLSPLQATLRELDGIESIVFGTALVLMGLIGTAWVRLSLRPLDRVTATAAEVSSLPLESGEVELPHRVSEADPRTEVGRLGRAFNHMLGHVEASLATRQASEARLRQFIADASHELRTPLAGIRGYTELALRAPGELSPDVRNALGRVDSESGRMSHLVDDLLLLARIDAGRPLAHEEVDLTRLAIDVTSDARVAGPSHHWVLDLPEEPVTVTGDQHRLHQVLANLLTNARTHTPAGTTVTVRLAPAADSGSETRAAAPGFEKGTEISVTDDGPGIPHELQEKVWERFARGDSARSRKAGSTGLGLAIVRAVVLAHHGSLSLTSEPGRTVFRIWLPAGA